MKKYLLTESLLRELLYGTKENKQEISNKLESLIQKNNELYISFLTLNQILKEESRSDRRKSIFSNINHLCKKILPVHNDDLPLVLGLSSELSIPYENTMELILAQKAEIDYILDNSSIYLSQKIISVINLVFKGK